MRLTKEDYESYLEQQQSQQRVTQMNLEATQVLIDWLKKKVKK